MKIPPVKFPFLNIENRISNSLFLVILNLKKENKYVNKVFECTFEKTQWNNFLIYN